jgi:hypothetical protein
MKRGGQGWRSAGAVEEFMTQAGDSQYDGVTSHCFGYNFMLYSHFCPEVQGCMPLFTNRPHCMSLSTEHQHCMSLCTNRPHSLYVPLLTVHTVCHSVLTIHTVCPSVLTVHTVCPSVLTIHTICPSVLTVHTLCPSVLTIHIVCPSVLTVHAHCMSLCTNCPQIYLSTYLPILLSNSPPTYLLLTPKQTTFLPLYLFYSHLHVSTNSSL